MKVSSQKGGLLKEVGIMALVGKPDIEEIVITVFRL